MWDPDQYLVFGDERSRPFIDLVRLTPTGRRTVDAALADLVAREQAILHGLSERQRATLAGLLRRLVAPFDGA